MKAKDFFSFIDEQTEDLIDEFVIIINDSVILKSPVDLIESKWVESGYRDFMYRVDPQRPELKQQRHIHIARKSHVSAKTKQVAWNQDGTRHDKKTFNTKLGQQGAVKNIAACVLNVNKELLESIRPLENSDVRILLEANSERFVQTWLIE